MSLSMPAVLSLIRSEPFSQVSAHVVAGSGRFWQPSIGSHESCVHKSVSAQSGGVPGSQAPTPSQVSSPLHTSASGQGLLAASYWQLDEQQAASAVLLACTCRGRGTEACLL